MSPPGYLKSRHWPDSLLLPVGPRFRHGSSGMQTNKLLSVFMQSCNSWLQRVANQLTSLAMPSLEPAAAPGSRQQLEQWLVWNNKELLVSLPMWYRSAHCIRSPQR